MDMFLYGVVAGAIGTTVAFCLMLLQAVRRTSTIDDFKVRLADEREELERIKEEL